MGCLTEAEAFPQAALHLARSFIEVHQTAPRVAALFATQQRWLLCHAALGCHYRAVHAGEPGLTRRGLAHVALRHGIASRNTAHAFFDEVLKYDVIRFADGDTGGYVVPTLATLSMLVRWYAVHFEALDLVDGGDRAARFLARSESVLAHMQPVVADALLSSPEVLAPRPLYAIFTWSDAGGLLMDRLIAGIDPEALTDRDIYLTDVSSISYLAQSFGLSRAHTSRKLSAAESIGGIGWDGRRGRSRIWISRGFYQEYACAHAQKLHILDHAFKGIWAAVGSPSDRPTIAIGI